MRFLIVMAVCGVAGSVQAGECFVLRRTAAQPKQAAYVQRFIKGHGSYNAYADTVVLREIYPAYYYSVGQELREEALAERIAEKATEKVAAKLELRLNELLKAAPAEGDLPSAAGAEILQRNCAACHTLHSKPVVEDGAPILFEADGRLARVSEDELDEMIAEMRAGTMPQAPREPLSDDDYLAAKAYLESQRKTAAPPERIRRRVD